jgi:S-formylglutathione hydrolase
MMQDGRSEPQSKHSVLLQVLLILAFSLSAWCEAPRARIVEAQVTSAGLAHNLFGDSTEQTVAIYLPAAYDAQPQRRFATVYLLHGYADTPAPGVAKILQELMDRLLASSKIEPMIVVAPNGLNRLLGSFYTNSEVTGNWEDYIVRDVVNYVDRNFRTIATAESRGLSGHSMGGYGSLMLAFKHPGYIRLCLRTKSLLHTAGR